MKFNNSRREMSSEEEGGKKLNFGAVKCLPCTTENRNVLPIVFLPLLLSDQPPSKGWRDDARHLRCILSCFLPSFLREFIFPHCIHETKCYFHSSLGALSALIFCLTVKAKYPDGASKLGSVTNSALSK